jgi:hypothetical protein
VLVYKRLNITLNGVLLDTVFPSNNSPTWKAIEHGLALLKEGVIWRVGDGKSTNILRHNWLPREMGLKITGTLKPCRLRRVANLMNEDGRSWNLQKIDRYFYPMMLRSLGI